MIVTGERLLQLRSDAQLERTTVLESRGRQGEDPAVTVESLPSVDELVVCALRDELLEDQGRLAEFGLARLASRGAAADAALHGRNADLVEFHLLRQIAEMCPELTVAVWQRAARLDLPDQ